MTQKTDIICVTMFIAYERESVCVPFFPLFLSSSDQHTDRWTEGWMKPWMNG